jgi:hypothetical protein
VNIDKYSGFNFGASLRTPLRIASKVILTVICVLNNAWHGHGGSFMEKLENKNSTSKFHGLARMVLDLYLSQTKTLVS